jgi:type II secretory pathway component PulM
VRVLVEDIAFDKLAAWLAANSTKNSIHAELFLVRHTEKEGVVNATLLFNKDF